jgi:hypothetical protein
MKTLFLAAMLALTALVGIAGSTLSASADRLPEPFGTVEREGI